MTKNVFLGGSRISDLHGMLPKLVCKKLDNIMERNYSILIGDANGVDKMIQNYLFNHSYKKVTVYHSGEHIRNKTDREWNSKHISIDDKKKLNGRELQSLKDTIMAEQADTGYMIWSDIYINKRFGNKCVSNGTMANILNLLSDNKPVIVYYIPDKTNYILKDIKDFNSILLPIIDQIAVAKWNILLKKKNISKPLPSLFD